MLTVGCNMNVCIAQSIEEKCPENVFAMLELLNGTQEALSAASEEAIKDALLQVQSIIAIPLELRTFENTMQAYDLLSGYSLISRVIAAARTISMVHPDEHMQGAADRILRALHAFMIHTVYMNVEVYHVLRDYVHHRSGREELSDEQRYYISELMKGFKHAGLELPDEDRKKAILYVEKSMNIAQTFTQNIQRAHTIILASREELLGMSDMFCDSLELAEPGVFKIGTDYPTYTAIMDSCTVLETRKRLYRAYHNRAYPENEIVLEQLRILRAHIAEVVGYETYADMVISDCMAKSTVAVKEFLSELLAPARGKERREVQAWTEQLPSSVVLSEDGKMWPWDVAYVKAQYKKRHFSLDEAEIAHYFPMESTMRRIFALCGDRFGLRFEEVSDVPVWHSDVRMVRISDIKSESIIGYLALDLHPRPNKYTHACHYTLIPAVYMNTGEQPAAMSIIIANVPPPMGEIPSLWPREKALETFLHELGHALHALLGRTHLVKFSGTSVLFDFVELPSQVLEEWARDREVLKFLGCHYVTGAPLPEELLDTMLMSNRCDTGYATVRQICLGLFSLACFTEPSTKEASALMREIFEDTSSAVAYDEQNHFYASFGHLSGYSARYYSYLWAKVYALDVWSYMRKRGFEHLAIGRAYVEMVLARGGSKAPDSVLRDFLHREPQSDAFCESMGFELYRKETPSAKCL